MTNKEKKERIQKEDGKAFETFNIERDVTYLNQKYTLPKQTANVMTGNGLLKVFELNPSEGGPSFIGRWDGGSRDPGKTERYDLDIDIYRVSREEKRRFNKGERGYSGHHTTKVESDRGYKYQVSLCTPEEKIFEGTVCFNLHRRIGVSDQISVRDRATAVVTRGRSPRPAAPLVDNFYYQTLRAGLFQLSSCFYASPKNLVPMKFAGGFGGGMIMPGTEDGEIPIRLASSDMISASHANYHSQTRARSQLPTDLPDVEQLLRNRPPRKVAKFSSVSRNLTLNQMPSRRIPHRD